MAVKTNLPMGIENFEEIRTRDFYYVDKTGLIRDLLNHPAKVNLFTRPRRFGKTLNMSMLKYFFEAGSDAMPLNNGRLFDGLEISKEKELCDTYMGKFPVVSVSLKGVEGENMEEAKRRFRSIIGWEASRFEFLLRSERLSEMERQQYKALSAVDENGEYAMSDGLLEDSLWLLSRLLHKHYGQRAILLIDEYDVPLDKAYQSGDYDAMVKLIRILFGRALKTNDSLYFAVLTGCLRISKESIFTGLNNFNVYTVRDVRYNEFFGFTDGEVRNMLAFYGFMSQYDAVKEWYDGYRFGNLEIYCPWDVINYCGDLRDGNAEKPRNYWVNTSSNDIVRKFVEKADSITRDEIELLIGGGSIRKEIHQELTYRDLDAEIGHLWSLLFTTGYLTQRGQEDGGGNVSGDDSDMAELTIPNREIRWIFVKQIRKWFQDETRKDVGQLERFCQAFLKNDTDAIEKGFHAYLKKTISIRDTNVRKERKENFYHGILLGILANRDGWKVKPNMETGDGYSDITVEDEDEETGIVIELKYAENARFEQTCQEALQQIKDRNYEEALLDDGMRAIHRYGIACYKKRCKVLSG